MSSFFVSLMGLVISLAGLFALEAGKKSNGAKEVIRDLLCSIAILEGQVILQDSPASITLAEETLKRVRNALACVKHAEIFRIERGDPRPLRAAIKAARRILEETRRSTYR